MLSLFPYGLRFNNLSLGGSVANAKAANVSIIKLTHNIYILVNGASFVTADPKTHINNATTLTVS
jgi:hypothetical protein